MPAVRIHGVDVDWVQFPAPRKNTHLGFTPSFDGVARSNDGATPSAPKPTKQTLQTSEVFVIF